MKGSGGFLELLALFIGVFGIISLLKQFTMLRTFPSPDEEFAKGLRPRNLSKASYTSTKGTLGAPGRPQGRAHLAEKQIAVVTVTTPITVVIAKTLSSPDVNETMLDILAMKDKPPTFIRWKLFCWSRETFELLQARLSEFTEELPVELILHENALKTYFWYNHLRSNDIPKSVDYVWLLDGDIALRHMAWDCYWNIIEQHKPAIAQPALIDHPKREWHNVWNAVSHPRRCTAHKTFSRLAAIETTFIEQQAAMFRRDAWLTVRSVLDERMGQWNRSVSTWGIDFVWCGVAQQELLHYSFDYLQKHEPALPYDGRSTCQVEHVERNKSRPIGCMIVQATPVVHFDTNAYDDVDRTRKKMGAALVQEFRHAMPEYYRWPCGQPDRDDGDCTGSIKLHKVGLYRSLWMERPCQKCRKWQCTPYTEDQHLPHPMSKQPRS